MKGVNLLFIVFFLLAMSNLNAQSESVNIQAWIEVVDLPKSKKIEIRGMVKNDSDQELTLYQKIDITKSGTNGTAKHQQSGNFTVGPNHTKILGRSSFYKNNKDNFNIVFQIRNDLGVIFTDSLSFPEKPISVQKEVVAKTVQPAAPKQGSPKEKESPKVATTPSTSNTSKEVPATIKKLIPATAKEGKAITTTKKSRATVPVDVLEIDGLIIDETRSKIARDFYDLFYKKWIAPNGAKNFSIYVREEPSRGRGAQVSLSLNDDKIFQNFVPPRYDALDEVVNYAIRVTRARLSSKAKVNDQLKEEDQMGTGI